MGMALKTLQTLNELSLSPRNHKQQTPLPQNQRRGPLLKDNGAFFGTPSRKQLGFWGLVFQVFCIEGCGFFMFTASGGWDGQVLRC